MTVIGPSNGLPTAPLYVPNRLYPLRSKMLNILTVKFTNLAESLLSFRADGVNDDLSVKHPGHTVKKPFSVLRSHIVELLVLLVEADASLADHIVAELWIELINWLIVYAHNNIYHSLFYRLLFAG